MAQAELEGNTIRIRDEAYELVVLPPMTHLKLSTLEKLEHFVAPGPASHLSVPALSVSACCLPTWTV